MCDSNKCIFHVLGKSRRCKSQKVCDSIQHSEFQAIWVAHAIDPSNSSTMRLTYHGTSSEKKAVVFAMYLSYRKASGGQPHEVSDRNPGRSTSRMTGDLSNGLRLYIQYLSLNHLEIYTWILRSHCWWFKPSVGLKLFMELHGLGVTQVGCSFPN